MKASEIKIGHVYYVNFEPVKHKEFGKEHLAVVLKKNNNYVTYIVVPLTSVPDKEGNKVQLDLKERLPKNLQKKETYAVYDQIRTVNASRFRPIHQNHKVCEVVLSEEEMDLLYAKVIENLLPDMSYNRREKIKNKVFTV